MSYVSSKLLSISVITFGSEDILFVGDSKAGNIVAFDLSKFSSEIESIPFNFYDVDQKIAEVLGVTLDQLSIKDLAIHPKTKEAYIAVHRGHGSDMVPVIVKINYQGDILPLNIGEIPSTQLSIPNLVDSDFECWNKVPIRTLTITDMKFWNDELFVCGLSNADFSSTLYRISYPFTNTLSINSIEIYHAVHDMLETRAPIRAMTILNINNEPYVLAAYLCTPLVTIPVAQLKNGAHVRGKTIGELGFGNVPLDIIHFHSQDLQGNSKEQVLITHKTRGAMLFDVKAIAESNEKEGLNSFVGFNVVAPQHMAVPLAGLVHVDNQDELHLAALRRDMETGRLNLISFRKGIYFRLSDFVSEFMLPGFEYLEQHKHAQAFQNMLRKEEGFV